MAGTSAIEWTDATWNPIVGCSIVSPGCTNCYAMRMAARIEAMSDGTNTKGAGRQVSGFSAYTGTTKHVKGKAVWTGKIALASEQTLTAPLRWRKPRRIFVNSMGDLFHEDAPDEWIDKVFAVMALCPQHQFQVLTKRAGRMRSYLSGMDIFANGWQHAAADLGLDVPTVDVPPGSGVCGNNESIFDRFAATGKPGVRGGRFLPNVWLGVSTERQQEADERIPLLLQTPAAIRFVSCEPLLGPIDLSAIPESGEVRSDRKINEKPGLDWIIVGGESGPGARPMDPSWARMLRDDCGKAGVPFFFKQWGAWAPGTWSDGGTHAHFNPMDRSIRIPDLSYHEEWTRRVHWFHDEYSPDGAGALMLGKKAAGRLLDGREHNEFPEARA